MKLERSVIEADNHAEIKRLFGQKDRLSRQVDGFFLKATKVGLASQLEPIQERLIQIQILLANWEKEFIEVRQEIENLNRQALNLEKDIAKLDTLNDIRGLVSQRDILNRQVVALGEKASKVGLQLPLDELQIFLKQIQIQLANKEKELTGARKGRLFVASTPEHADKAFF